MKHHTIKINEEEKKLIVYFMKKHLEIHNKVLTSTGENWKHRLKYKKEIKLRKSILKALGENTE